MKDPEEININVILNLRPHFMNMTRSNTTLYYFDTVIFKSSEKNI